MLDTSIHMATSIAQRKWKNLSPPEAFDETRRADWVYGTFLEE